MSKVQKIIDELKDLSLLDAAELVKAIEETFNVSAAAPVAVAAAGPVAAGPAAEEKTEFNVVVDSVPADKKISVIKAVKDIKGIGLGDAKTLVESAPFTIAENVKTDEANKMKETLATAGASVSLK